jgi:hypothetical protein
MESCPSYKPWHNKKTGKTYLKPDQGKCLHYYFYFIDEDLGLCWTKPLRGDSRQIPPLLKSSHCNLAFL